MTATTQDAPSIMLKLKESTQKQHDATEDGLFNQELVKGNLPRERYVEMLAQLFLIHQAMEGHLRQLMEKPTFRKVLRDYQFQEPYLAADLKFFGRDSQSIEALPATKRIVDRINEIARSEPAGLLGMHYVFEGSNNGSKFISKAVRRAYQLGDEGTRYLDPYGDQQRSYWQQFKDDMNAVDFLPPETTAILRTAGETFEGVMKLHGELHQSQPKAAQTPAAPAASKCPFHAGAK